MRRASAVALLVLLHHPLLAQDSRRAPPVPTGARVRIDTKSGLRNFEGTVVAWRADTVLVKSPERVDTLRFARTGIQKLRILESPALWRYNSPSEINYYFTAAIPRPYDIASATGDSHEHLLLIGTKTQLVGVNPTTGAVTWARKDLADLKAVGLDIVGSTGFAIVTRGDTLHIIDLRTGVERWNSATVSFLRALGWLPSPNADTAIIMLGHTKASPSTLIAIDLATGHIRWRQDSAFSAEPKVFQSGGVSYLFGNQSPYDDSDTTLVLYLSTDGPIRLDARTGRVLWRGTAVRGAKLPLVDDGYASILKLRDVLVVPSEDSLVALHSADGSRAWSARAYKKHALRAIATRRGLLIRGYDWFDLLDPATGHPVWREPVELKNATWDELRGDTDYVVGDKRVVAIGIADGNVRTITDVKFKEDEQPTSFTVWRQGLIVNSWHNLMLVDRKGTVRYQREYPSPNMNFGERLRSGGGVMRPTTRWAGSRIFFYTGVADSLGHEGFSVVEVDPADGHEAARLWFDGRVPTYSVDGVSSVAYYRRDETTLEALPLLDGRDLDFAARNGHSAVVEQLLSMGVNPTAADEDGWTPLHLAALTGHGDVLRQLISRGAKPDQRTHEGWTPWMLAFRERHDSLAQALRSRTDSNAVSASVANGWRLAHQGKIPEALAEITRAAALDSTLGLWPTMWRMACWNGALAGQASAVLAVCDRAVDRTPADDAGYDSARRSRAIARALSGNLEGAAADLEATGASADDESSAGHWIAALRQGRNPFTPAVLETMRR